MAQLRSTFLTVLIVCGALLGSACGGGSSGKTLQGDAGPATVGDGDIGEGLDGGSDDQINIEDGATDEDDAATAVELDAGELDAGACPAEQPADECGVCGGHGESCRHPLAGSYAVRTQLYARQKTTAGDGTLDLVSKGVVLSVANIDARGTVQEHYCLLEISNEQGVFSWTTPAAMQAVADTQIALEQQGDKFVRPLAAHHGYFSFSPAAVPADCVPGQLHASGCKCPSASSTLPDDALDCRVIDVDGDGIPGGKLYVGLAQPEDPADAESVIRLNIAALLNLEWRLGQRSDGRVLGAIGGGLEQVELSREGELSEAFGEIKNAMCPSELGRVELVAGDHTCATILAARNLEMLDYGLFDLSLDADAPALESCVDPDTICHKTRDECGVCGGSGIPAGACDCAGSQLDVCGVCAGPGPLPGTCDCAGTPASIWYADVDGDGLGDPASTQHACTAPVGYVAVAGDPDVTCATAKDVCGVCGGSGIPTGACNCAGAAATLWYEDADADGLGNSAISVQACTQPTGFVANANDHYPSCATTPDVCGVCGGSGVPAGKCNCQGAALDACGVCGGGGIPSGACNCAGAAPALWYEDTDGDGLGNPAISVQACGQPTGFVANANDSDPSCATTKDVCGVCGGSGIPAGKCNCQGAVLDACGVCAGNGASCAGCDGVPNSGKVTDACGVCGGNNSTCAGCDGVPSSGKTVDACGVCGGSGIPVGACNCQGTLPTPWYLDGDGDGLGDPATSLAACRQPAGYVANASDGDPSCATARDVCGVCGGIGVPVGACNCAGAAPAQWYLDADGDGLGDPATSVASCSRPAGYVANANDTDPSCATTRDVCGVCGGSGIPAGKCDCAGHVLDACNVCGGGGIPVGACSCSGAGPTLWYGDADGDGKGDPAVSTSACARPQGYVNNATDNDPTCATARDACGTCAGTATTCPLLGNYAVRSAVFAKGKSGQQVNGSKAISFALMTITANGDGTLRVVEQGCYAETQPITGTTAYSWSKPAWSQAVPAATRTLTRNANGSWQREDTAQPLGWSPGRRPSSCSDTIPDGSATPLSPWPSGSGTTCTCNLSTNTLPPFDKSAPYDCRLLDVDQDGYPGVSAFASTEAPATPSSDAGGLSWARIMLASNPASTWTITPASNGAHSATLFDRGQSSVVGCVGGGIVSACGLVTTNPVSTTCPQQYNRAQFAPVAQGYTCSSVVTNRATLFPSPNDGSLPDDGVCAPP